jgi:hypothetical protein
LPISRGATISSTTTGQGTGTEATCGQGTVGNDVWFRFSGTGTYTLTVCPSTANFVPVIVMFHAITDAFFCTSVSLFNCVGSVRNAASCSGGTVTTWTIGTNSYQFIRVGAGNGVDGNFILSLT